MSKLLALSCTLMLPSLAMAGSELKIFQPEFQSNSTLSALSLTEENTVDIELVDAIALTLRHNRSIRSAYLTRIAQKFDLKVARDQYAPQLSIKVSYLRNRNHTDRYRQTQLKPAVSQLTPYGTRLSLDWAYAETRADVAGRRFNDGANFLIIQPLLRGAGRAIASAPLRQAQLTEQFNRLALKLEVAQVITRTITLYRSLLRAQEQLRIAQEGLLRAKQLVEVNRALITAGRMAAVDIVQAEAEVASQTLAREGSRNYLQQSRLALAQLLAVDLSTALRAVETLEAQPLRVNTDQALRRAELLQPTYLMQRVAREQATIDLEVAKDAQLWNLSLIGGASQFRERPDHQRMWEHYVGLELEVPIDDLSRRQTLVWAQVGAAQQALNQAESYQQLQREVINAVRDIEVSWRQLKLAERALELSKRKVNIEREKLGAGRSTNFQVLSYESDLRYAQSTHLDATLDYLDSQSALDHVVGSTLESWGVELND